jgi:hypothetical protein
MTSLFLVSRVWVGSFQVSSDVMVSEEWRSSISNLSTLELSKQTALVGESIEAKLTLRGINNELVPNHKVKLVISPEKGMTSEINGLTTEAGEFKTQITQNIPTKVWVEGYDNTFAQQPLIKIQDKKYLIFINPRSLNPLEKLITFIKEFLNLK